MSRPRDALSPDELAKVAWHISTKSDNGGGNCVEAGPLADGTGRVAVRHSRHPNGEVIVYTRGEWEAFIAGAKEGEFDFSAE
ncbi:DUF397 domain-containing protein [Thermopolyspora sp. NPDC052614]|uniref:DUF397 domain-containing protein n=1 Tax=Thermopolyspora sp. NPDC052614 TaxID=3155682 RepID=UPI0034356A36